MPAGSQQVTGKPMRLIKYLMAILLLACIAHAQAADGLIKLKSPHSAKATMDKLEAIVKDKGLNVFARIDHVAGAAKVGKTLCSTEVLIFGNAQGGTLFMVCTQTINID